MTANSPDERIAKLNKIIFDHQEPLEVTGDSLVVLRNLGKSSTLISSIQHFFQPHKLKYVRIFEETEADDEDLDLNLRNFHIGSSNTGSKSDGPMNTVSVLIEFDEADGLEPFFERLCQVPNPFGRSQISIESMNSAEVQEKDSQDLLSSRSKVLYDSIVIENINEFWGEKNLSTDAFEHLLSKFKMFGDIDAIYFPTKSKDQGQPLDFKSVGFIGFSPKPDLNEAILKCIYFLHDLDLSKFSLFTKADITELSSGLSESGCAHQKDPSLKHANNKQHSRLQLSICQKKHEPFLFNNDTGIKLRSGALELFETQIQPGNLVDKAMYRRFSKSVNFQQSNIYVNNLPIVFQNDDSAWFDFWIQFGPKDSITLAKIIKPQFYTRSQTSPFGKFGFVFYNDIKPALKAILLTNNRLVSGFAGYPKFHIEASFAIQKSPNDRLQMAHQSLPLWHDGMVLGYPPLQFLPSLPLSLPVYDKKGYYTEGSHHQVTGKSRRSRALSRNLTAPVDLPPAQALPPHQYYYNFYMGHPYHMQASFAPYCGPPFAPMRFHHELPYGSQYSYPYPGPGDI